MRKEDHPLLLLRQENDCFIGVFYINITDSLVDCECRISSSKR